MMNYDSKGNAKKPCRKNIENYQEFNRWQEMRTKLIDYYR